MPNSKTLTKMRDIMIAVTAVLMILVVVFQMLEVQKFELMDVIKTRIGAMFGSDEATTPAVAPAMPSEATPGLEAGPPQNGAPGPGPSGIKNAVNAKHAAEADAGL